MNFYGYEPVWRRLKTSKHSAASALAKTALSVLANEKDDNNAKREKLTAAMLEFTRHAGHEIFRFHAHLSRYEETVKMMLSADVVDANVARLELKDGADKLWPTFFTTAEDNSADLVPWYDFDYVNFAAELNILAAKLVLIYDENKGKDNFKLLWEKFTEELFFTFLFSALNIAWENLIRQLNDFYLPQVLSQWRLRCKNSLLALSVTTGAILADFVLFSFSTQIKTNIELWLKVGN